MHNDIIEISEEMLHEVVGAAESITCGKDEALTVEPLAGGRIKYTCD